jgi:hypothetical protein
MGPRNLSLAPSIETRKTRLDPCGVRVESKKPRLVRLVRLVLEK